MRLLWRQVGRLYTLLLKVSISLCVLDDAVGDYGAAYDLAQSSGYTKDIPKILNNLGVLYRRLGRHRSAERTYNRSLELKEVVKDTLGIANTLHNLGRVEISLDKTEKGLATLERAARLYEALEMPEELPGVEISKGIGYYESGKLDEAEMLIKRAIENPGLKIDAYGYAKALLGLGSIYLESERYEEALKYLEEGLPYAEQANVLAVVTNFNRALGQTYEAMNRPDTAYGHFTSY